MHNSSWSIVGLRGAHRCRQADEGNVVPVDGHAESRPPARTLYGAPLSPDQSIPELHLPGAGGGGWPYPEMCRGGQQSPGHLSPALHTAEHRRLRPEAQNN